MSEFLKLEADAPATLGAVVEVVTRLSTCPEAELLELVAAGKIRDVFPFRPTAPTDLGPDTVDEDELVEASAMPLSREHHAAVIQSSLPRTSTVANESPSRGRGKTKKARSSQAENRAPLPRAHLPLWVTLSDNWLQTIPSIARHLGPIVLPFLVRLSAQQE
jgi:hypothetical protein